MGLVPSFCVIAYFRFVLTEYSLYRKGASKIFGYCCSKEIWGKPLDDTMNSFAEFDYVYLISQ